jgi:hypothetical protein
MCGKSTNDPEIARERALTVRRSRGRGSDADLGQAASASLKALIDPGTAVSDSAATALLSFATAVFLAVLAKVHSHVIMAPKITRARTAAIAENWPIFAHRTDLFTKSASALESHAGRRRRRSPNRASSAPVAR